MNSYRERLRSKRALIDIHVVILAIVLMIIADAHPLNEDSKCSKAYLNASSASSVGVIPSVLGHGPLPAEMTSLKSLNIGFGSTGTRTVYLDYQVKRYSMSCHWMKCYKDGVKIPPAANHFRKVAEVLTSCLDTREKTEECRSETFLDLARTSLKELTTSSMNAMADNPINYFFREILDLVPNLEVLHSVRDPFTYSLHRVAEHPKSDIMCDPRMLENREVSTPFNILECISKSTYVHERLVRMLDFMGMTQEEAISYKPDWSLIPDEVKAQIEKVASYYTDFNQRAMNTVSSPAEYRPICVWDEDFP